MGSPVGSPVTVQAVPVGCVWMVCGCQRVSIMLDVADGLHGDDLTAPIRPYGPRVILCL